MELIPECTFENIHNFMHFESSNKCEFTTQYCKGQTIYVDTIDLYYCQLHENLLHILVIAAPWLILCFYLLSSTSEKYLEPCLSRVAKTLKLSESLAGVTLMALANGAPDIISAYVAGSSKQKGSIDLAFGALIGAAIFATTIILARVVYSSKDLQLSGKNVLRDCGFFILAIIYLLYLGLLNKITLGHIIGLFVGYGFYVFYVVVVELRSEKVPIEVTSPELPSPIIPTPTLAKRNSFPEIQVQEICEYPNKEELRLVQDKKTEIIAIQIEQRSMGLKRITQQVLSSKDVSYLTYSDFLLKVWSILIKPLNIFTDLTVPRIDRSRFNRIRVSMYPCFSTLFILWQVNLLQILYTKPVFWVIFALVSVLLGGILWIATRYRKSIKKLSYVFTVLGLAVAVIWVRFAASLLVDLLALLKVTSGLPSNFIGLTILAWGNSANDFFVDVAIAKKGYGVMAVSGIFAGQFFNLLIGFGITLLLQGSSAKLDFYENNMNSRINYFLMIFLLASLISMAGYGILRKFKMCNRYTLYLFIFYVVFCVVITLITFF